MSDQAAGDSRVDPHAELRGRLETLQSEILKLQTRPSVMQHMTKLREARSALKKAAEAWEPLERELEALNWELKRREGLTIGPWVVSRKYRWFIGTMYVYGRDRAWYNRRVWLRVVTRDERSPSSQWEVEVDNLEDGGRRSVTLGPPGAAAADDFRKHAALVETLCRDLGYYVVDGEEQEE